MRSMPASALTTVFALLSFFLPASIGAAQEASTKIVGGDFAPTAAGLQVAFVATDEYKCTGTLVGKREILTAAHCVEGGPGAAGTAVYVGGAWRTVESAWYHSKYDSSQPLPGSARYDLGMLILSQPVENLAPLPVLRGRRIAKGRKIMIAGYGSNELSDDPSRSFLDDFKLGLSRITKADGRLLFANHRAFQASTCAGDSGGPSMVLIKKKPLALVGVLSAGINLYENGRCYLQGNGRFIEVDLQSPSSQAFLSAFEGVEYAVAQGPR